MKLQSFRYFVFLFTAFCVFYAQAETYRFSSITDTEVKLVNHDGALKPGQKIKFFDAQATPTGSGVVEKIDGDVAVVKVAEGRAFDDGVGYPQKPPIEQNVVISDEPEIAEPKDEFSDFESSPASAKTSSTVAKKAAVPVAKPAAPQKSASLHQQKVQQMKSREKLEKVKNSKSPEFSHGLMLGMHYSSAANYQSNMTSSGSASDVTIKSSGALGFDVGYENSNEGHGYQLLFFADQSRSVSSINSDMPGLSAPSSMSVMGGEVNWTWGEKYMGNLYQFKAGANITAVIMKSWQGTNSDLSGQYGGFGYQAGVGWGFAPQWMASLEYRWSGGKNSRGSDSMPGMVAMVTWTWDRRWEPDGGDF